MKIKKVLALVGITAMLSAGAASLGAVSAIADAGGGGNLNNTNAEPYWENLYQTDCYKFEANQTSAYGAIASDGKSVTLTSGTWKALIVNGGSSDSVTENPALNTAYAPPKNNGDQVPNVSHWIACAGTSTPTPTETETSTPTPTESETTAPDLNASVTGEVSCLDDGTYSIVWSGTVSGAGEPYTLQRIKYTSVTPPIKVGEDVAPNSPFTYTTTAPGTATSASAAFHVHVYQPAGASLDADVTGNVEMNGECRVPVAPPTIQQCTTFGSTEFTSLEGWDLSKTRATGHNELVDGGLHVWTEGAISTDKAAGYYPASFALKDVGAGFGVTATGTGTAQPSLQLLTDLNNDGAPEGYLVAEPVYGTDTLWLSSNHTGADLSAAPTTVNGGGTGKGGTANAWLTAFPDAQVMGIGYSLGSGVLGDWTITAITAGCHVYTFDLPEPTPTQTTTTPPATETTPPVTNTTPPVTQTTPPATVTTPPTTDTPSAPVVAPTTSPTTPVTASRTPQLPRTGSDLALFGSFAGLLLLIGSGLVLVARKNRD